MHIHWMYMQVKSSQSILIFCVHFYDTQINWIDDSSMQSIYYIWSAWNIWIPTDLQKKSHFFGWFIINGTVSRFIGVVDVICVTSSPKSSLGITCMSHLFSEHALDSLSHVWASRFNVPVFFFLLQQNAHTSQHQKMFVRIFCRFSSISLNRSHYGCASTDSIIHISIF